MQRHLPRVLATSIYPLLGLAALMALADCTAVPTITMANGMMKPTQVSQTTAPSPDIFSGLAQRMNIMPQTAPDQAEPTIAK